MTKGHQPLFSLPQWLGGVLLTSALLAGYVLAYPQSATATQNLNTPTDVLSVFEDHSGNMTLEQVQGESVKDQFRPASFNRSVEFSSVPTTLWFRVPLHNEGNAPSAIVLALTAKRFVAWDNQHTELFLPTPLDQTSMNDSPVPQPLLVRHAGANVTAFEVVLQPGQQVLAYLRVRSLLKETFSLKVHSAASFSISQEGTNLAYGFFFGAMLIMVCYNLFLFALLKDVVYLFYVVYVATFTLYISIAQGYSARYLWPGLDANTILLNSNIIGSLSAAAACMFTRRFLRCETRMPLVNRGLNLIIFSSLLFIPVSFWLNSSMSHKVFNLITLVGAPLPLIAGIIGWRQGVLAAKYFVIGWLILLLGVIAASLASLEIVPVSPLTTHLSYVGAVIEVVLLSYALASQITKVQREKSQIQLELLETQTHLNEELERQVTERTRDLDSANLRLMKLSTVDELTELYNRRYFNQALETEYQRLQEHQRPLALIMADVDFFKQFNDVHGHLAGDECLRKIGELIRLQTDSSEHIAARYGGEEFVLLLPDSDQEYAREIAESLRTAIDNLQIAPTDDNASRSVTMSFGVASLIPEAGKDAQALIKMADAALYRSKDAGRNRVSL